MELALGLGLGLGLGLRLGLETTPPEPPLDIPPEPSQLRPNGSFYTTDVVISAKKFLFCGVTLRLIAFI